MWQVIFVEYKAMLMSLLVNQYPVYLPCSATQHRTEREPCGCFFFLNVRRRLPYHEIKLLQFLLLRASGIWSHTAENVDGLLSWLLVDVSIIQVSNYRQWIQPGLSVLQFQWYMPFWKCLATMGDISYVNKSGQHSTKLYFLARGLSCIGQHADD